MSIISKETFDKFTEEEKQQIRDCYKPDKTEKSDYSEGYYNAMVDLFGKENLQPEPKIRIWEDIGNNEDNFCENYLNFSKTATGYYCLDVDKSHDIKVILKVIATIKIAKLIELGYGGMVSEEEWKDDNVAKYAISTCVINDKILNIKKVDIYSYNSEKYFIAFHISEQREEFMSYPENRKLVEQYYMI